jgi:large subunit ribosomal protein L6
VKGSKGSLTLTVDPVLSVAVDDGVVTVERENDERASRARHGLTRALLNNMVVGVSEGFTKELNLVGVGYRAALKGKQLELQVGFSHPVVVDMPEGITFEVPEPTKIIVSGIDKQQVGQVAADIRAVRPPEPYKGKGIRYVGEYVVRKAGKAAAGK